jgi:hypothetical protein
MLADQSLAYTNALTIKNKRIYCQIFRKQEGTYMASWQDCRVKKAGANAEGAALYVYLQNESLSIDGYYELDSSQGNQLLAVALTALSLDLPVDAFIGNETDPRNPELYYYCTALYVRRGI